MTGLQIYSRNQSAYAVLFGNIVANRILMDNHYRSTKYFVQAPHFRSATDCGITTEDLLGYEILVLPGIYEALDPFG